MSSAPWSVDSLGERAGRRVAVGVAGGPVHPGPEVVAALGDLLVHLVEAVDRVADEGPVELAGAVLLVLAVVVEVRDVLGDLVRAVGQVGREAAVRRVAASDRCRPARRRSCSAAAASCRGRCGRGRAGRAWCRMPASAWPATRSVRGRPRPSRSPRTGGLHRLAGRRLVGRKDVVEVWFSPMITITCLIGVAVVPSPSDATWVVCAAGRAWCEPAAAIVAPVPAIASTPAAADHRRQPRATPPVHMGHRYTSVVYWETNEAAECHAAAAVPRRDRIRSALLRVNVTPGVPRLCQLKSVARALVLQNS